MNLEDISEEYQKSLVSFFNNEKVIEHIYKEQYGEDDYKLHEDEYKKQYKEILDNTVFIPYITLEDVERFLRTNVDKYGENFVKEKYGDMIKLCTSLNAKKKRIIEKYTDLLLEEIEGVVGTVNIDRKMLKNTNFTKNVVQISDCLNLNEKNIFQRLKKKKVDKIFESYRNAVKGKLVVETTSYFKHKRDISSDKYLADSPLDLIEEIMQLFRALERNLKRIVDIFFYR